VVIAFVLAFLFRTFEAEAFVIPTGSMAPTLMGRHKDFDCPKCGYNYQASASDEVDVEGGGRGAEFETVAATCPMCRYTADIGPRNPQHANYPSYNGDRILVSKFAYEWDDPQRWDVIVFKFPGDATTDARTNFIKRLVGLPGETIRIQHGDIWVRRGKEPFEIARKPPDKLLAMLQPVFDNDLMPKIAEYGWPERWRSENAADGDATGAWHSENGTVFQTDGAAKGERWLRYHHIIPSFDQWQTAKVDRDSAAKIRPQLINDFTAYNTSRIPRTGGVLSPAPDNESLGQYWVGDLALECRVDVESNQGDLVFDLRKGGRFFRCRVDVATGKAVLSVTGKNMADFHPTATTALKGSGRHDVRFSNCDNELRLWIDNRVVTFDAPTTYQPLHNTTPDESDRAPVGVGTAGVKAAVSHLVIRRDLYYIADMSYGEPRRFSTNESLGFLAVAKGADARLRNHVEPTIEFPLKADQFFALGDNSARSKDGRLWGPDNYWVPHELLIGEALFIYWPHSWNKIPYVNVPFPFFPNFARMGVVR
jgi:signal peptidase I